MRLIDEELKMKMMCSVGMPYYSFHNPFGPLWVPAVWVLFKIHETKLISEIEKKKKDIFPHFNL
jgi:hypothetical protein